METLGYVVEEGSLQRIVNRERDEAFYRHVIP